MYCSASVYLLCLNWGRIKVLALLYDSVSSQWQVKANAVLMDLESDNSKRVHII